MVPIQSAAKTTRKMLDQPETIQAFPCAKEAVWLYADGHLNRCTVASEIGFGEARIPADSVIVLLPDGSPLYALLSQKTMIGASTCAGGSWLGPAEGPMTSFYASGKLKQCYLAEDQEVQGIPCMNGGIFGDGLGGGAIFLESGKLKSCRLSKDYLSRRRGERFVASK
jgi:hypothetical protein